MSRSFVAAADILERQYALAGRRTAHRLDSKRSRLAACERYEPADFQASLFETAPCGPAPALRGIPPGVG